MDVDANYKGRWLDAVWCFLGLCKLYTVIVTAGAGYQRGGVTVKATTKDVTVKVCPICNYMRIQTVDDTTLKL